MTKIAIASCSKIGGAKYTIQKIQPAWKSIEDERPDIVVLLGDIVYMRQSGPRWQLDQLDLQYQEQFKESNFSSLIASVPFMATWDDHDFGPNNACGDTDEDRPFRARSRRLFHQHMKKAINNNRPEVYCSHVVGDVKIILLDGRYYRTGLQHPSPTILGAVQEQWLARELNHGHKYTVVGCGTCLTHGDPNDKWQAYTQAYVRLQNMLAAVPRLLYVSGDIHENKFVSHGNFHEVISSGVGRQENRRVLNNYGIIDFRAAKVNIQLRGAHASDHAIRTRDWRVVSR